MFSSQRKESAYELVAARKERYEHAYSLWALSLSIEASVDPRFSLFLLPVGHWIDTVSGP